MADKSLWYIGDPDQPDIWMQVAGESATIGRNYPGIGSARVSGRHFTVRRITDANKAVSYWVTDQSTNGTFIAVPLDAPEPVKEAAEGEATMTLSSPPSLSGLPSLLSLAAGEVMSVLIQENDAKTGRWRLRRLKKAQIEQVNVDTESLLLVSPREPDGHTFVRFVPQEDADQLHIVACPCKVTILL